MTNTGKELEKQNAKSNKPQDEKILSLASGQKSEVVISKESNQLSKNLAESLMGLIEKVNADGVTPETVNASCNAASAIYKILRLNFDMKKEGF